MKIATNYSTKYLNNIQPNYFERQNNVVSIGNHIQPVDKFVKSNMSKVSFKGDIDDDLPAGFKGIYKGADFYGTQEDRNALKYRIKFTPEVAYKNLEDANNIMEGLAKNYKLYREETNRVAAAFKSYKGINIEYGKVASERLKELAKGNPAWSKTPVVGVFIQMAKVNKFVEQTMHSAFHVTNDYVEIIGKYFDDGVARLHNEHTAMSQGVGLLMAPFLEDSKVNKMAQNLCSWKGQIDGGYEKLETYTINVVQKMADNSEKVADGQMSKQLGRSIKKGVMFFLTYGVGDFAVDVGLDAFADSGLDHITDEIADLHFDDISGNVSKEIAQNKSSKIISLTDRSLINILRKIR